MTIKERNFIKDNFSETIYDNANNSGKIKYPYLYNIYRCDNNTLKKSVYVSPPSFITVKLVSWIMLQESTSENGVLIKKPQLK